MIQCLGYKNTWVIADGTVVRSNGQKKKAFRNKKSPYLFVALTKDNGKGKNVKIHQLVCVAYHGPKPLDKTLVRHLDGNPLNNHPDNLAWGTPHENYLDSVKHGTHMLAKFRRDYDLKNILLGKGIYKNDWGTWCAAIRIKETKVFLGVFATEAEATAARVGAVKLCEMFWSLIKEPKSKEAAK